VEERKKEKWSDDKIRRVNVRDGKEYSIEEWRKKGKEELKNIGKGTDSV
jgi:hypothetical protein